MFTAQAVYVSRRELVARLVFWAVFGSGAGFSLALIMLRAGVL